MVKILSVFLGLITGLQPVSLRVGGEVAAVELQVDGRTVGVLRGEPWEMICDFGEELAPHELVAIGRDHVGREVAREHQWINLPRPRSEAVLTLAETPEGPPRWAAVQWHSVDRRRPDSVNVTFDGESLDVVDPRKIELPPYDPNLPHLLTAELVFGSATVRTQIVVGSVPGEEISTELTAIPVILKPHARLPAVQDMAGWFVEDGKPLRVVAVERGGADVLMVKDPSSDVRDRLDGVRRGMSHLLTSRSPGGMFAGKMVSGDLGPGVRLSLVIPVGESAVESTQPALLFPVTPDLADSPGSVLEVTTVPFVPDRLIEAGQVRIADAVAVAGLVAATEGRARAVVLILDPETVDESRFDAPSVRAYLSRMQVPLLVWTPLKKRGEGAWGAHRRIATADELVDVVEELRELLDRQRVVWLAGRHLPHRVTLSTAAGESVLLAGAATAGEPSLASTSAPAAAVEEPPAGGPGVPEVIAEVGTAERHQTQIEAMFRGSVEVQTVNVDVVVTDDEGNRVTDLREEDFEVYEDRASMEITHFVPPREREKDGESPPDHGADEALRPAASARDVDSMPFHLVILFDAANIRPAQRGLMVESLRGFLDEGLPASTQVMLVAKEGPIRVKQTFTGSPAQVMDGFDGLLTAGHIPFEEERRALHAEIIKVAGELDEAYGSGDPAMIASAEASRSAVLHRIRSEAETERFRMRANFDVLEQFVSSLGGVPGRKVLLYVGDGLTLNPADDLFAGASRVDVANDQLEIERHGFGLQREADELVRQANANGVTFYTVTPPSRYTMLSAAMRARGPVHYMMSAEFTRDTNIREGACLLSDGTGGRCQTGGSEPERLFSEAAKDLASTYTLAYSPARPSDGRYHRIEVRVRRSGLRLRYRQGYIDRPHDERLLDRLAAALRFDVEDNPLGMALEVEEPQPLEGDRYLVPVHLTVPVERLAFLPGSSGSGRDFQAKLLVATIGASGRTAGPQEYPITFHLAEDALAPGRPVVYSHRVHLTLASGGCRVAIGFWDEIGRVASFLTRELEVGEMIQ